MAYLDITAATTQAYKKVWEERAYILRLAAIPFMLKLFCFAVGFRYANGLEDHIRFTLILLPAYLAEGWMLAHLVRLWVFGHRWPFRPTGNLEDDLAVLEVRARGILSGMLVFVLINMALGLFIAFVSQFILPYMPQDASAAAEVDIPASVAFVSFVLLVGMFWGFRLLWLYIPYAIGMEWRPYVAALRGVMTSVHMMGLWLMCFVPIYLVLRFGTALFGTLAQSLAGDAGAAFVMIIFTVLADTLKSIIVTSGMTYALMAFFKKNNIDKMV